MILLIHNDVSVVEVTNLSSNAFIQLESKKPVLALFELSEKFPKEKLIWCHQNLVNNLNFNEIKKNFYLKNMMMSFSTDSFLPFGIGYIEDSPFINVNKNVKYPTWLMSSQVGVIYGEQLSKFRKVVGHNSNFDYTLNSIAKLGMPKGLFCYSNPNLLKNQFKTKQRKASIAGLFKFVRQHYKRRWVFLLMLNFLVYERRFPLVAFIYSILYKRRRIQHSIRIESIKNDEKYFDKTVDVIIPTIGRKQYLFDVLKDLANQTLLPRSLIIVEQNPNQESKSELDYLQNQSWPFKIVHVFTHKTGACNARNIALNKVTADYVYLADDDNRFEVNLLEEVLNIMISYNLKGITMSYLQDGENEIHNQMIQWPTFGAGCSVVKTNELLEVEFDQALEHGYGEDADFGMQLRNRGIDILYTPNLKVLHLKAPMGGFRTRFYHPWVKEKFMPKPSPTVMYYRLKNSTTFQLLGYKLVLFFKYYKSQKIKNPIRYFNTFKKQWANSVYWSKQLKNNVDL